VAFHEYLRIDGVEIVNAPRMDAYTKNLGLSFYRCTSECPTLVAELKARGWTNGDYRLPNTGEKAPWWDKAEPYSSGFAGISILDITNIESTTITSEVAEGLGNGGWVANRRYGTREMVVRALLVGTTLQAVRHGFNWLTSTLRRGGMCADAERNRHTYNDLGVLGPGKWTEYKETGAVALPNNVWQANRYHGLATTDLPPENTYAKLSGGGPDGMGTDLLDKLLPLSKRAPVDMLPRCGDGNKLQFFIQCPGGKGGDRTYRYMYDVYLAEGPTVLSYREVDETCGPESGAWEEIEFRLVSTDPFIWREEILLNRGPDPLTYGKLHSFWTMYKNTGPLTVDDDVWQAPLVRGKPHTYNGLMSAVWDRQRSASPFRLSPEPAGGGRMVAGDGGDELGGSVLDPYCPRPPQFPGWPSDDVYCTQFPSGPYTSVMFVSKVDSVPKYSPVTFRVAVNSRNEELRGVRVSVLSGDWAESGYAPGFTITYMPPMSSMVFDGRTGSFWLLTGDSSRPDLLRWTRADHLVRRGTGQGALSLLSEFICEKDVFTIVDIPTQYQAAQVGADVAVLVRDA